MYQCESWTTKNNEWQRIDAFELWCWRRFLRVPWTARRSNQSVLKEINPEYSLEGLVWSWNSNTWTTCCKEPTHWKRPWCWEILRAGDEGAGRGGDFWMASSNQWTRVWISPWISKGFPDRPVGKECTCNAGDTSWISESGKSTGEGIGYPFLYFWASLVAQLVKNMPAMWENWVPSLGWEDPLENRESSHCSILAWTSPWTV